MQSNRFQAFSDSDNDYSDDDQQTQKQNKPVDPRSRAEKRQGKQKTETTSQNQNEVKKQSSKPMNERQKPKGVSADPHPLDKHSGSGLKTHDRKGGAGKGNWGTYKDDVQQKTDNVEQEEKTEEVVEEVVEEEQLTLEEYMNQFGGAKKSTQQQTKGNQDYSEFKKEGCVVIEKTAEIDDRNPTKKKGINDKYIGMQNTDLLGFRTGIKTFALREEKPREFNENRQERKPREQKEQVEKKEGEQTETTQEGKTEQVETEKKSQRNNDNRGGNRGGYKGNRGGYKGDNNRGGYNKKAPQKTSVKVNLEDDSLFPKLG